MDRFRNVDRAQRRRAVLGSSAVFGVAALLLGAYLVEKAGSSNDGSPGGWLLITLGIVALLLAFGIVAGVYDS